jgi:YVTN family beta-propeller protein
MLKKFKLYSLISLFCLLASCGRSCDYEWRAFLDFLRFVYIATAMGIYGLSGPQSFLLQFTQGIYFDDICAPFRYVDSAMPFSNQKPLMYGISSATNSVYVIDSNSDQLITKITVGNSPMRGKFSAINNSLYVTNFGSDSISVINQNTNLVTGTIPLLPGSKPTALSITQDGLWLYDVNSGLNSVSQVDLTAKKVVNTFGIWANPTFVSLTPDDSLLYVGTSGDNAVSIIDAATFQTVKTVSLTNPTSIMFNREGSTAYITSGASPVGSLVALRTSDYSVRQTISVGANPVGVTRDAYDTLIYVVNKGSSTVTILQSQDNSIVGTIPLGAPPNAVVSIP